MMDEDEPRIARYRLSALGFWVSAFALGLLALSEGLSLWAIFTRDFGLRALMAQEWWTWVVVLPIPVGAVVGSYLFWGRWTDLRWQRRAGLLVLLNVFDLACWALSRAGDAELIGALARHEWLLGNAMMLFGWVEFYLFADLAAEVAWHLDALPPDRGRAARTFSLAGLTISATLFAFATHWPAGWPLIRSPRVDPVTIALVQLGVSLLRVITSLQVVALCAIAGAACQQVARALREEAEPRDPFGLDPSAKPRDENPYHHDDP